MGRLWFAFRNSLAGFRHALGAEAAFRQEVAVLALSLPAAWILAANWTVFFVLVGAVVFMLLVELLNTAIEAVCNGLSRDYMPEIRIAKDCGSAAVLLSLVLTGGVWLWGVVAYLFR